MGTDFVICIQTERDSSQASGVRIVRVVLHRKGCARIPRYAIQGARRWEFEPSPALETIQVALDDARVFKCPVCKPGDGAGAKP